MCLNIMENSGGSNWTERGTYIYMIYHTVLYGTRYYIIIALTAYSCTRSKLALKNKKQFKI